MLFHWVDYSHEESGSPDMGWLFRQDNRSWTWKNSFLRTCLENCSLDNFFSGLCGSVSLLNDKQLWRILWNEQINPGENNTSNFQELKFLGTENVFYITSTEVMRYVLIIAQFWQAFNHAWELSSNLGQNGLPLLVWANHFLPTLSLTDLVEAHFTHFCHRS